MSRAVTKANGRRRSAFRPGVVGVLNKRSTMPQIAVRLPPELFTVCVRLAEHRRIAVGALLRDMIAEAVHTEWDIGEVPEALFDGWEPTP